MRGDAESSSPQSDSAQADMRMSVIGIDGQRFFVDLLRVAPAAQAQIQDPPVCRNRSRPNGRCALRHSFQHATALRSYALLHHQHLRFQKIDLAAVDRPCGHPGRRRCAASPRACPSAWQDTNSRTAKRCSSGIGCIELAENLVRLNVPAVVLVSFAEVIAQLADGLRALPLRDSHPAVRYTPARSSVPAPRAPPPDRAAYAADGVRPRPEPLPSSE